MNENYPDDCKATIAKEFAKFTDNDAHRASVLLMESTFAPIDLREVNRQYRAKRRKLAAKRIKAINDSRW